MRRPTVPPATSLEARLEEANATIRALLAGQIDAVVDEKTHTPVLLAKAQDALRESEERYRRIVETTSEGISMLDTCSKVSFVNETFAAMLGYSPDEMIGKPLSELVPESEAANAARRVDRSRAQASEELEVIYRRKDGVELWAKLRTTPILDADGRWAGTLGMITDRTGHRKAEEALRKSEREHRQIVETTSDGIVKVDHHAVIVFVNRRFAEMLGYEPSEIVGKSIYSLLGSAATRQVAESLHARANGSQEAVDTSYRHKDGTEIAVNVAGSPLFDAAGVYAGSLGVVRDVTERNKMQSQLMVSDRMASVGTLAAGVAHEINNPLSVVIANLDFIGDTLKTLVDGKASGDGPSDAWFAEEVRSPLVDACEAADRVRFIVRDLKIFSRSPAEEPRGPVDVKAIMESSLRMGWNEIRHRAQLVKDYGPVPPVVANEARLGQVFLNLIVNAAQAVPDGRAEHNLIRVSTRLVDDRVIIEVTDTGPGIPPENIGRIFDAFFTTKPVGVGTGLGLAICHRIVTDLGGELTVNSVLGKGTTFRVALPIATEEARPSGATVGPAVIAAGRRGRILVVDDEQAVLSAVRRALSAEHDVTVTTVASEALALCAAGARFDLVICDLMMPDMTGMDLHRELARIAPAQAKDMLFMTGGAFTDGARRFLSETANEVLEKPFARANLRGIVNRYLR